MSAGVRRAASLLFATMALATLGVAIARAQWPTTCVELNDLAEAAAGNHQNVGIYQRAYGDQAEAQCQTDHREDVRRTFAWALGGAGGEVTGTWPTSCVALNDLAEAARGNSGNVGLYQRVYPDAAEAEGACRSDHRADVLATFAWAIPPQTRDPAPEVTPTPPSVPPAEHPDYQRVRDAALARSGDADLASAVAANVIERRAIDSFLRGTDAGVQYGQWNCPSRSAACPLAPEAATTPPPPPIDQGAQGQIPGTVPTIRLSSLVEAITVSIVDRATIDLSNLNADQTYEVVASSSSPRIVGIGDCPGASEWTTVTEAMSRTLWFFIRGCAPGTATVTVEVRPAGATSAAASVSQHVTVEPIPAYVWAEFRESAEEAMQSIRDAFARARERPVQRPFPPRLSEDVSSATTTAATVSWATWWATAPTGDVATTGFQLRYWPREDRSGTTTLEITDANAWRHSLTGLAPDTWYVFTVRACTIQEDCSTAEWSLGAAFKTLPG